MGVRGSAPGHPQGLRVLGAGTAFRRNTRGGQDSPKRPQLHSPVVLRIDTDSEFSGHYGRLRSGLRLAIPRKCMRRVMRALFSALLAGLLSGCTASGTQFSPSSVGQVPGQALVYVYRSSTLIGVANADVPFLHLDGRQLTRIRIGGSIAAPISPGQHTLTTTESLLGSDTGKIRGKISFSTPAGSTLYLRYSEAFKSFVPIVTPGVVAVISSGSFSFEPVPAEQALRELADTKELAVCSGSC
jgi:hypothetical protein